MGWFSRMLEWCLGHRVSFSVVVVAVFAGSVVVMSRMPQNFFPQLDKPYFRADVILPEGYDLMATQQNLDTITQWLREQEEVVKVSTTAGATPLRYYLASGSWADTPNYGNLLVQVSDKRYTKEVKQRLDRFVGKAVPLLPESPSLHRQYLGIFRQGAFFAPLPLLRNEHRRYGRDQQGQGRAFAQRA